LSRELGFGRRRVGRARLEFKSRCQPVLQRFASEGAERRPVEAHTVLAPALEGFSTTPEMPEIGEALA
jgi:hypothetical protein